MDTEDDAMQPEIQDPEAEQNQEVDDHMQDKNFVDFIEKVGKETGTDLANIRDKELSKYAEIYDEVEGAADDITGIIEDKLLDKMNLGEVAGQAKTEVKAFLLDEAAKSPNSIKRYIDKIKTYNNNLAKIQEKEAQIEALKNAGLTEQRQVVNAQINEVRAGAKDQTAEFTAKQAEYKKQQLDVKNSDWNGVKRAANWLRTRGKDARSGFERASQANFDQAKAAYDETMTGPKAEIASLKAKLAEIDGQITALKDAETAKVQLKGSIQNAERVFIRQMPIMKKVQELMLEAAKKKVDITATKKAEDVTLEDFAEGQDNYDMWSGSREFSEFQSTDPDYDRLGNGLKDVLEEALTNEINDIEAGNLGGKIERFNSFMENSIPQDPAKAKKAIQMIRSTLQARLTSGAKDLNGNNMNEVTEPVKRLYINRVIRKMKLRYK